MVIYVRASLQNSKLKSQGHPGILVERTYRPRRQKSHSQAPCCLPGPNRPLQKQILQKEEMQQTKATLSG